MRTRRNQLVLSSCSGGPCTAALPGSLGKRKKKKQRRRKRWFSLWAGCCLEVTPVQSQGPFGSCLSSSLPVSCQRLLERVSPLGDARDQLSIHSRPCGLYDAREVTLSKNLRQCGLCWFFSTRQGNTSKYFMMQTIVRTSNRCREKMVSTSNGRAV